MYGFPLNEKAIITIKNNSRVHIQKKGNFVTSSLKEFLKKTGRCCIFKISFEYLQYNNNTLLYSHPGYLFVTLATSGSNVTSLFYF